MVPNGQYLAQEAQPVQRSSYQVNSYPRNRVPARDHLFGVLDGEGLPEEVLEGNDHPFCNSQAVHYSLPSGYRPGQGCEPFGASGHYLASLALEADELVQHCDQAYRNDNVHWY